MKLELQALEVSIQGSPILRGIDLVVESGEKVGLIGRNGAGKTTVIRSIVGLNRVGKGSIRLDGREVNALTPDARARMGIGWMPEDRRLVPLLTVEENILLPSWANPALNGRKGLEAVYALIPELTEMASRKALQLSGGQQKLVALGRALLGGTGLLLLDEPFEGVAPALSQRISQVLAELENDPRAILIAQSELNHSARILNREVLIERGAIARPASTA